MKHLYLQIDNERSRIIYVNGDEYVNATYQVTPSGTLGFCGDRVVIGVTDQRITDPSELDEIEESSIRLRRKYHLFFFPLIRCVPAYSVYTLKEREHTYMQSSNWTIKVTYLAESVQEMSCILSSTHNAINTIVTERARHES